MSEKTTKEMALEAIDNKIESGDMFAPRDSQKEEKIKSISEPHIETPRTMSNPQKNTVEETTLEAAFGVSTESVIEKAVKKAKESKVITTDDIDEEETNSIKEQIMASEKTTQDPFAPKSKQVSESSIAKEDVYDFIPDIEGQDKEVLGQKLYEEIEQYRKDAILKWGLTQEEADAAAAQRMVRRGKEINDTYVEQHPTGVVTVDKVNAEKLVDLNFSEEEKKKIQKAKAIRLIAIEDKKLNQLKVKKIPPRVNKVNYIRTLDAAISTYRVPLPIMGDYAQFTGAQTVQMITAFSAKDDTILDMTVRQAQLCYDRFYGSTTMRKYDENNRIILTYEDFINSVPYEDLKMMLYGLYVASTPEEQELDLICGRPQCQKEFTWKINAKQLVQVKELPKAIQERMDDILNHTQNADYLKKLGEDWKQEVRYESPYTGNIYALQNPTIAKVIDVFSRIDQNDQTEAFNAAFLIVMNSIYFKLENPDDDGDYIEVSYPDDIEAMIEIMKEIPEVDLKMLSKPMGEMSYNLPLKMFPLCPHCHNQMENELGLDQLVFQKARDMSEEIM